MSISFKHFLFSTFQIVLLVLGLSHSEIILGGEEPPIEEVVVTGTRTCEAGKIKVVDSFGRAGCAFPLEIAQALEGYFGHYSGLQNPPPTGSPGSGSPAPSGPDKESGNDPCNNSGKGTPTAGNPISIGSGNKYQAESDFVGGGMLPLSVERFYNSNRSNTLTVFGKGWTSSVLGSSLERTTANLISGSNELFDRVYITKSSGQTISFYRYADEPTWYVGDNPTSPVQSEAMLVKTANDAWVYSEGDITNVYLPNGKLYTSSDSFGNALEYFYNTSGQLHEVKRNGLTSIKLFYNSNGLVNLVTDPDNKTYRYFYDSHKNLTSVQYPNVNSAIVKRTYHYEMNSFPSLLTGLTDENNHRYATWQYLSGRGIASWHGVQQEKTTFNVLSSNATNRVVKETNPLGKSSTYSFSKINGQFKVTSVFGEAKGSCLAANQHYTYDANGYQDKVTDWQGHVTDYDYNAFGALIKETQGFGTPNARSVITKYLDENGTKPEKISTPYLDKEYFYDSSNKLRQYKVTNKGVSSTSGNTRIWNITYTYHPSGMVKQQIVDGPRDIADVTTSEYDLNGNLVKLINALGHVTTFSNYNNKGQAGTITEPSGKVTTNLYHPRGWLTRKTVSDGITTRTTQYIYDNAGLLKKVINADNSSLDFSYDNLQRLIKITDPNNFSKKFNYDPASNITKETISRIVQVTKMISTGGWPEPSFAFVTVSEEKVDQVKNFEFDALSRLEKIIEGNSQSARSSYRKDNLLEYNFDGLNKSVKFNYDALKRLKSTVDKDGKYTFFYYDDENNLTSIKDKNGNTTVFKRDGYGQIRKIESPDTGNSFFEYDKAGNIKRHTDGNNKVSTYIYDSLNRVKSANLGGIQRSYLYDTDKKGYLFRVIDNSGTQQYYTNAYGEIYRRYDNIKGVGYNTYWYFDTMGRVKELRHPDNRRVYYTYNNTGGIQTIKTRLGSNGTLVNIVTDTSYKAFGPVSSLTYGNGEQRVYQRDLSYRLKYLSSGTHMSKLYIYNANNDITYINDTTSKNWDRSFVYDNNQRLKSHTGPDGNYAYSFDNNGNRKTQTRNSVTTINTIKPGSNKLTKNGTTVYELDAAGNTKKIGSQSFIYDGANRLSKVIGLGTSVDYLHNSFGERIYREFTYPSKPYANSKTVYFYGTNAQLLYESSELGTGSTEKKSYIYFNDEVVAYIQNNVVYYVHSDHLGRPEVITNIAKSKVWEARNDSYGRSVIYNLLGHFNVGFPGQYYDDMTGLYYNYFRDYDPTIGRYIQSDPIGIKGGVNTYSYVSNNPISNVDFFGLTKCAQLVSLLVDNAISSAPRGVIGSNMFRQAINLGAVLGTGPMPSTNDSDFSDAGYRRALTADGQGSDVIRHIWANAGANFASDYWGRRATNELQTSDYLQYAAGRDESVAEMKGNRTGQRIGVLMRRARDQYNNAKSGGCKFKIRSKLKTDIKSMLCSN